MFGARGQAIPATKNASLYKVYIGPGPEQAWAQMAEGPNGRVVCRFGRCISSVALNAS